jgi:hypothetical protein
MNFNIVGRLICLKFSQNEKQQSPSEVIELGREICVNDKH